MKQHFAYAVICHILAIHNLVKGLLLDQSIFKMKSVVGTCLALTELWSNAVAEQDPKFHSWQLCFYWSETKWAISCLEYWHKIGPRILLFRPFIYEDLKMNSNHYSFLGGGGSSKRRGRNRGNILQQHMYCMWEYTLVSCMYSGLCPVLEFPIYYLPPMEPVCF